MGKKSKRGAIARARIETLLTKIDGPLPEGAAASLKRWVVTKRDDPDLLTLLEQYAKCDLLRAGIRNVPRNLRGYPGTVVDAKKLVSRLQSHTAQLRRKRGRFNYPQMDRILQRIHAPAPDDVRAERQRDKNPLFGTSILRGASRAKRDRPRYHPD